MKPRVEPAQFLNEAAKKEVHSGATTAVKALHPSLSRVLQQEGVANVPTGDAFAADSSSVKENGKEWSLDDFDVGRAVMNDELMLFDVVNNVLFIYFLYTFMYFYSMLLLNVLAWKRKVWTCLPC